MTSINPICLIILFGLQTFAIGSDTDRTTMKVAGLTICTIGWILNIVAIVLPHVING